MNKITRVLETLKKHYSGKKTSADEFVPYKDPFRVLISCILSLRTRDSTTIPASKRLFKKAGSAHSMSKLTAKAIEKLIYPVGFYKTKAKRIREICRILTRDFDGKIPEKFEDLLKFRGVGKKTASIVMVYGHNKPEYIPVDTHVHRISNRLGWVKTKTPEQTMDAMMEIIPKKYWHDLNNLLVKHGQNICVPISPFCYECPVSKYCKKMGVGKRR